MGVDENGVEVVRKWGRRQTRQGHRHLKRPRGPPPRPTAATHSHAKPLEASFRRYVLGVLEEWERLTAAAPESGAEGDAQWYLARNFLVETSGHESALLRDAVGSRALERLLEGTLDRSHHGEERVHEFLRLAADHLLQQAALQGGPDIGAQMLALACDRNASHVLQRLVEGTRHTLLPPRPTDEDDPTDRSVTGAVSLCRILRWWCGEWFGAATVRGNAAMTSAAAASNHFDTSARWTTVLADAHGAHVLRAMFTLWCALPPETAPTPHRFDDANQPATLPESWTCLTDAADDCFTECIADAVVPALNAAGIPMRRSLLYRPQASASLQVLLWGVFVAAAGHAQQRHRNAQRWQRAARCLFGVFWETLADDMLFQASTSRFVETMVRCVALASRSKWLRGVLPSQADSVDAVYERFLAGSERAGRLAQHALANYVFQRVVETADGALLSRILFEDQLMDAVVAKGLLWGGTTGKERGGLLYQLLRAATTQWGASDSAANRSRLQAVVEGALHGMGVRPTDEDGAETAALAVLLPLFGSRRKCALFRQALAEGVVAGDEGVRPRASLLGSLILQALTPLSARVQRAFTRLTADEAVALACDSAASHALEQFLKGRGDGDGGAFSDAVSQLTQRLVPAAARLATSPSGSRVIERAFDAMGAQLAIKRSLVRTLSDAYERLSEHPIGRRCLMHCRVALFMKRPHEWETEQRQQAQEEPALPEVVRKRYRRRKRGGEVDSAPHKPRLRIEPGTPSIQHWMAAMEPVRHAKKSRLEMVQSGHALHPKQRTERVLGDAVSSSESDVSTVLQAIATSASANVTSRAWSTS